MLNFPKIPKITLRKFSTAYAGRNVRNQLKIPFFWVALHIRLMYTYERPSLYSVYGTGIGIKQIMLC